MLYFSIYLVMWSVYNFYNYYIDIPYKINNNYLSFSHSVITSLLSYIYLQTSMESFFLRNLIVNFSSSYFVWDSLRIIINKEWKDWAFIYHHYICLLMLWNLYNGLDVEMIANLFFVGELSNFFNYVVYHMIQTEYSKYHISLVQIVQFSWFVIFRVYYFSTIFFEYYNNFTSRFLAFLLISIYIMGLLWGWGQLKKTVNGIKYLLN